MENVPQEDRIKDSYNYEDWWEARAYQSTDGVKVDVYFEHRKINKAFPPNFKTVSAVFLAEELKKIISKQEELFYTGVSGLFKSLRENFVEQLYNSNDKPKQFNKEIEACEKLFDEGKFPLDEATGKQLAGITSKYFYQIDIATFRSIYKEKILVAKRDFSLTHSPYSRLRNSREEHELMQVEACLKYFGWLTKYKKHYDRVLALREPRPTDLQMPVNEFQYIEDIISDGETHINLFRVFCIENNIEDAAAEREKYKDDDCVFGIPGETDFFEKIFKDEIQRIKNEIHKRALSIFDKEAKTEYFNHIYQHLKSLIEKNWKRREQFAGIDSSPDRIIHVHYWYEMHHLKESMEKDFKSYLNPDLIHNIDEHKFEHRILHSYHECFEQIEKHRGHRCGNFESGTKRAAELFSELKTDYLDKYDYIVQKWIKKNKERGYIVTELNFIHSQLKRMETLFTPQKKEKTISAADSEQKIFTFSQEFYDKYMTEIFLFLRKHWQSRLKEIYSLNISPPDNNIVSVKPPTARVNENSFVYSAGENTEINLIQLQDKLANDTFISKPKDIRTFRKLFSGKPIKTLIEWKGTLYELHYFVQLLVDKKKVDECNHFSVAVKCFCRAGNEKINYSSLRTATRPPEKSRMKLLEIMVETI